MASAGGIESRKLWSTSPSAVDQYRKCARSWYYSYVLKVERGPTPPFMARGTAIHTALEQYQKTGEVLVEVEAADLPGTKWPTMEFVQAAIPHLPRPHNDNYWDPWRERGDGGIMLEQSGEMPTWADPGDGSGAGPTWKQYIDHIEAYPDRAIISDFKTSSDFRYAKTPEELSTNVQLVANAKWLFSESDYKEITLRHLYLLTKTKRPKALVVSVVVTREHVEAEWQKILATVREMVQWVKLAPENADPLPPNTDHCSMYSGCAFKPKCYGDSGIVSIRRNYGKTDGGTEKMGSLLANMLKTAGGLAATTPANNTTPTGPAALGAPAVTAPAPTVGLVVPAPGKLSLASMLASKPAAPTPEPLTPESAQAAAVAAGYPVEPPKPVGISIPTGIVPPDAPSPISTPEEVAAANPEPEAEAEEKVEEETAGEKTKRKRRTKAEMEAARTAEAATALAAGDIAKAGEALGIAPAVEASAQIQTVAPPAAPVAASPEAVDETLKTREESDLDKIRRLLSTPDSAFECAVEAVFVDCMPVKGWPGAQPVDLIEHMHAFNSLAAASAGAADYRLIRYESKGYLATAIRLYMRGLPKVIYVDSHMSGADVFLEVVIPYAKLVVRGVR